MNEDIEKKIERVYDMFETSFLHRNEELILHKKWCKNKLDRWFRKEFTHDELQVIYQKLGCGANMPLGVEFIKSGLNMDLLNA